MLVLRALAAGRTKYNEIEQAVGSAPHRTLGRLIELQLIERYIPVTEDPARTRRKIYRIADNFLAFWLTLIEPRRSAIERGLGKGVLPALLKCLDDFMGPRFEEALRIHIRRLAARGKLDQEITDVGPFWTTQPPTEIDVVALAGREHQAVLVGEAKWARNVDAKVLRAELEQKAQQLPKLSSKIRFAICAREKITNSQDVLAITAKDIFTPDSHI